MEKQGYKETNACTLTCPAKSHTRTPGPGKGPECWPRGPAWRRGGRRALRTVPAGPGALLPGSRWARAQGGGSTQSRGPGSKPRRKLMLPLQHSGNSALLSGLPIEVRLRVKQLPKDTKPRCPGFGATPVITGTCMRGQVLAAGGPRGARVRAPPLLAQPLGISSWGGDA